MEYKELNMSLKNKAFKTTYNLTHTYNHLLYGDEKNKLCIGFSPRAGCSISFQCYLDLFGLLPEALKFNSFIHKYRTQVFNRRIKTKNINTLKNYTFIKFIMNPYIRAVSIYRLQTSCNLSFRCYLKQIDNIKFNRQDIFHMQSQYIPGEENIPFNYIKIDENQCFNFGDIIIDVNKYNSIHHGKKIDSITFCGDIPRETVNQELPSSYKYFYDDEIKQLVYNIYKQDIDFYKFNFIK